MAGAVVTVSQSSYYPGGRCCKGVSDSAYNCAGAVITVEDAVVNKISGAVANLAYLTLFIQIILSV